MSENSDLEEFSRTCFEDPEDMLEFAYEKIENSVFIWALWCKVFAPEMADEVSRKLAIEFVEDIHKQIAPRLLIHTEEQEQMNVLKASIRKYRERIEPDDLSKPE